MNKLFSVRRLLLLGRKELIESYRTLLIVIGAVTGALLINYAVGALPPLFNAAKASAFESSASTETTHFVYFSLVLFIGGFIITSRSFVEIHVKSRNHDWLMLPASLFEKYLVRVILTSIGVALVTVIYYFLFSLLVSGIAKLLSGSFIALFNPLSGRTWLLVANYLVAQSLFLAGAGYFKRAHFIKTVLALSVFAILLAIIAGVSVRLLFGEYLSGAFAIDSSALAGPGMDLLRGRLESAANLLWNVVRIAHWVIIAPLFWVFGYARLRETEVRNGV